MTVQTTFNKQEYTGNGVTTKFDFSFPFFVKDDIIVTQIDTSGVEKKLVIGTDYSIPGVPFQWWNNGSSIILVSPLADQYKLIVERIVLPTQETSLRNLGRYDASAIEKEFDKLTMICQQITGNYGDFLSKNKAGTKWLTEGLPFDSLISESGVTGQSGSFTTLSVGASASIASASISAASIGSLTSNLDAESSRILNLPAPSDSREPLRKGDAIAEGSGPSFQYVDDKILTDIFSSSGCVYSGLWGPNKSIPAKASRPNNYAIWELSNGKIIIPTDKADDGFTTGATFADDLANGYWFINPIITADTSPLVATSFYDDDLTKAIAKSKNVFINEPVVLSDKCEITDQNLEGNGVGSLITVAHDKDGIYLPINDNRSSSRQLDNLQMSGFDLMGADHKTRLLVDKGSLGSSYNDLWLQRAYLGLCMERVMELNANSINVQQCNMGFYLASIGKTGGGATATWLRGMRAQFNNLGGLIYRDADENPYIAHNVNIDGGLLQENRKTGLAVINAGGKNDELTNYMLNSFHIENNKRDDPTSSSEFSYDILNDDRTVKATVSIPSCDVYVNAANLTIKDSKFTVSYDKPIILRNGAVLTLSGVSGFGKPSGYFIYDSNLDDNWNNARSSFIETGDTSLVGTRAAWCQGYGPVNTVSNSLTIGVSNTTLSPYAQNRYPNNPCLPVVDDASEITRQDFVLDHVNCKRIIMSASVDSGNNQIVMRNLFQPSDNSASKYDIITFLVYPARDSLWNISRDDGGISSKVKLRGGEWNRIVITSIGRSNTAQRFIVLRPSTDVSGDNYVTALNTAFGDYSTVSNIYENGLFNPLGNQVNG